MPANIAHMVIVHKAFELLRTRGFEELAAFARTIDDPAQRGENDYWKYMNLGSVGPDLYYYASMVRSGWDMLVEGFVKAAGVTPWSYHLHSCVPTLFPLNLCEILFRDVVHTDTGIELDADDARKLAYIAGHLSHVAADQIIHPLVNRIAKPYYRSGENRKKHRECEVFQDYFLYEEVYRDRRQAAQGADKAAFDFFRQDFRTWVDCVPGLTTRNTHDWFRYFLQRGFVETYGSSPSEDDIENSVDNLLAVLLIARMRGPYREAADEYNEYGGDSPMYREYVAGPDYRAYYEQAVQLSAAYIAALYEVYATLSAGQDFTPAKKKRFESIVRSADLSCPLQSKILETARRELTKKAAGGTKYKPLFEAS
ncbi:MAG: zinc dependent phospholipase C family protein [Planctomycetes bacterium]|nr:zinc dependent phospholipase C family protein [Planctomycetota bacterium]